MTAKQRKQVHSYGQMVFEIALSMGEHLTPIPRRIPRLPGMDPENAARQLRESLGLPALTPIADLVGASEAAGVLVISLPISVKAQDAYSLWTGSDGATPVAVLLGSHPTDRLRFSLAHELGHLVLHDNSSSTEAEREADMFAAALLMPRQAINDELGSPTTLTRLAQLKQRWNVSLQALARRARDLDLVTQSQYSALFRQIGSRGWRIHEPGSDLLAAERPRALRQMAEILYGNPIRFKDFAGDMDILESEARVLLDLFADSEDVTNDEETRIHERIELATVHPLHPNVPADSA